MIPFALARPALRLVPPEAAHRLTLAALRMGLGGRARHADDPILACRVWGRDFANPIGMAAGFDKDAQVMAQVLALGFGFHEVGSVTPLPQPGNPRPRVFRLTEDEALINRLGFNSRGIEAAAQRLVRFRARWPESAPVGVNLGINRDSAEAAADYRRGAATVAGFADYLVVNVSSPNTPGLRALQSRTALAKILRAVRSAVKQKGLDAPPPLLLKIAPDLTAKDKADVAKVAADGLVDGLIVSNTTIARPAGLRSRHRDEAGGLSGRPLMEPSTALLGDMHGLTGGEVPMIGVGGVFSGEDAYRKIRAGASLVQLYTGLVYRGPGLVDRIKRDLADRLRADGFTSVAGAVGAGRRPE